MSTVPTGPHGGDVHAVARALGRPVGALLDLSASLNPVAPDVTALVRDIAPEVRHYPDATAATVALAAAIGVDADRLVLTNGGAEAIALVAATVRAGHVVEPEFSLYRRHLEHVDATAGRWRSNPSSPLGRLAEPNETAAVWDEAFFALATGAWTRGDDRSWRLGSLTKLWACPGLRLGYVIASDAALASAVRERQPRWSVGALALAAVEPLLAATDLVGWQREVVRLRGALVDALRGLALDVTDTDANWVLVHRPGLRDALIPHGVLVRDCGSFGLTGTVRVAVPDDAGRERLVRALEQVLA